MSLNYVTRQPGKILECKKYNQSFFFILNDFCTDIVFQLNNGTKVCETVYNLNLPIYVDQVIELVSVDDILIAFEDKANNEYYYLSTDPANEFERLKISWTAIFISTLLLYVLVSGLAPNHAYLNALVLLLPLSFRIFGSIQNEKFEKKLDKLIVG